MTRAGWSQSRRGSDLASTGYPKPHLPKIRCTHGCNRRSILNPNSTARASPLLLLGAFALSMLCVGFPRLFSRPVGRSEAPIGPLRSLLVRLDGAGSGTRAAAGRRWPRGALEEVGVSKQATSEEVDTAKVFAMGLRLRMTQKRFDAIRPFKIIDTPSVCG